jgi:hypothetical protein
MLLKQLDSTRLRATLLLGLCATLATLSGCVTPRPNLEPANTRAYDFETDRLAFANQLEDYYQINAAAGTTKVLGSNPNSTYVQHCFVLSRSSRQFFQFAHFEPNLPKADDETYRKLVDQVVDSNPRDDQPASRIVIPGYRNLYEFSKDKEALLKAELGGRDQSFFQRGNWRMVFPFSKQSRREIAYELYAEIRSNRPPVVHLTHLVVLPDYDVNHAMLLYAAHRSADGILFLAYDPNNPARPARVLYDADLDKFSLPASNYFAGGEVHVYEVYNSLLY